jgi:hypothetical protein
MHDDEPIVIPTSTHPRDDQEWFDQRNRCVARVVSSSAPRKVIVAGPGTGKTHAFRELFKARPGNNLTLTFIRSLVADLEESLTGLSDVYTFHGFAKKQLYESPVPRVSRSVTYYPRLLWLFLSDLNYLRGGEVTVEDISASFHDLDDSGSIISDCLRSGAYYDAVGHDDSVFRVLAYYRADESNVPAFDQVVVDEYQDFNALEVAFINQLASRSPVLIVGDDDQALYWFKHASPEYLRERAEDSEYESFMLPFSTRCPSAVVEAVRLVTRRAAETGLLAGRIDKPYVSFVPAKRQDDAKYPVLVHAACSVERKNASYMSRYISQQVEQIPREDIEDSRAAMEPTALVLGPSPFIRTIFDELAQKFPGAELRASENEEPSLLDGYKLLRGDPRSRLGWRIVSYVEPLGNQGDVLRRSRVDGEELADLLPKDYIERHLRGVALLDRHIRGAELDERERRFLEELGIILGESASSVEDERSFRLQALQAEGEEDETLPKIVITTLVGAKGLQASHVFVVGLNAGHFPKSNERPTDDEVCRLLVALTRTKKQCHLLSFGMFAGRWWEESIFLEWLKPVLRSESVDKSYFEG